jgi:hypothetical protein
MQECPQCRKLFDPVHASGDFCPDCADAIRAEFELPAVLQRVWTRLLDSARGLVLIVSPLKEIKAKDASLAKQSRLKSILVFVMHQFVGTWGAAFIAYFIGTSLFSLLGQLGWHPSMRYLYWILTETPFYPVQIALGFYFGMLLGHRFHHRMMIWVWVLPFTILCLAVATNYSIIPEWTSVLARSGQNRWSYYFGWSCRPSNRCLDRLEITMPFYVAVAYSTGGLLAQKFSWKVSPNIEP